MKVEIDRKKYLKDLETVWTGRPGHREAKDRLEGLAAASYKDVRAALIRAGLYAHVCSSMPGLYIEEQGLKSNDTHALENLKHLRDKLNTVIGEFE